MTPYVIEEGQNGQEKVYDIYSRMLKDRVVFIRGEFNPELADLITAQLLFLESQDKEKDIYLYINSPGGMISSMFSIFDTMRYITPDVVTITYGQACSAGSFILAAGAKGKRNALKNSDIMIHELSGGHQGKFHEMKNSFEHTQYLYDKMADYYVEFTGQSLETIKEDMRKDFYMSAEAAKKYGLIDSVHESRETIK
jgi:ATP-dependent Clp protease protease subunit